MTDFTEKTAKKSAVRALSAPFTDITAFQTVVNTVLTNNPFECTAYTQSGKDYNGVTLHKQYYTAKVIFEDDYADTVGTLTIKAPTPDAFTDAAARTAADSELAEIMGGSAVRDAEKDVYYCQLKCHDANGDTYYVTFTRAKVTISSYSDDAVLAKVEEWADTVSALN